MQSHTGVTLGGEAPVTLGGGSEFSSSWCCDLLFFEDSPHNQRLRTCNAARTNLRNHSRPPPHDLDPDSPKKPERSFVSRVDRTASVPERGRGEETAFGRAHVPQNQQFGCLTGAGGKVVWPSDKMCGQSGITMPWCFCGTPILPTFVPSKNTEALLSRSPVAPGLARSLGKLLPPPQPCRAVRACRPCPPSRRTVRGIGPMDSQPASEALKRSGEAAEATQYPLQQSGMIPRSPGNDNAYPLQYE